MRQSHLLGPPPSPAAEAAAREQKFTPSPSAWLRCVWVNYCCYAPDAPKKDTVVYTGRWEGAGLPWGRGAAPTIHPALTNLNHP